MVDLNHPIDFSLVKSMPKKEKGQLVGKVKREPGYLYYVAGSGNVRRTPMKHRKK